MSHLGKYHTIFFESNKKEGWTKETRALEVPGVGCVINIVTKRKNPLGFYDISEAGAFAPSTRLIIKEDEDGNVLSRQLMKSK